MSDELTVATITIKRVLRDDDDIVFVEAADASGDALPLVESLGLLRMAEDSVIRLAMGEAPDGDDGGDT